ncbi:CHASE2 domain-containing serine/threonine-protein kinase [Calothrix sp. PCC 6303]|uniref:CHASE2 domain-containing serine/threonine-protein kinase n=1 Tax=Calothrix sp. PCC 6303 TaxID=1170562 RepID=UPI0002A03737|nr:CHASE2 domain-containing serine/threonine-protein kinase [Calothrix sp. PCC 6303]AFY99286.1 CHASE2 domain protein [Calothrix sp. PCC 6303]
MTGIIQKLRAALVKYQTPSSPLLDADSRNTPVYRDTLNNAPKNLLLTVLLSSAGVTALVLGVRSLQLLQPMELLMYDGMMRLSREGYAEPDPRLLLVEVTQEDVNKQLYPLTDATVNQILQKLQSYQPRIVALNINRSNQKNLGSGLTEKEQSKIIGVCRLAESNTGTPEIPAPQNLGENNIGFSDLISDDSDRIVRRSLLSAKPEANTRCNTSYSFAAMAALNYLEQQNIYSSFNQHQQLKIGDTIIPPLKSDSGNYEKLDARGYQVLINYRRPDALARRVNISQILNNQVKPEWVKDKLVMIGVTAESVTDSKAIYTPYSNSPSQPIVTPPLYIHAQVVSQILSTVLDGKPLIWYWQNWGENLWVFAWALLGGVLALRSRHPYLILVLEGITVILLVGIGYILFIQGGWIPILPAAIALVMSSIGVVTYTAYRTQQQTKIIIIEVEKQQEAIAQLSALLQETRIQDIHSHPLPPANIPEKQTGDFLLAGRYQITRVLGSGGFGCTYLAKDTQRPNEPNCVVKQLMPARRDPRFLEVARRLFDTEAEILQVLGKHHQIPDLLAYFEEEQEFYLVQEYIQGKLLSEELPPNHQIKDQKFVVSLLKDILEVLSFVHAHRVIHRDIKPTNIIRNSQNNRLVLIDFGAVKTMQPPNLEKTELATIVIGTRGYAPPEQLAGHPRLCSDIYALGIIAIQSLTGIPAYEFQTNLETGSVQWQDACEVREELAKILDKMVLYHFSDRYQTAAQVLEDLNKLVI